MFKAMTSDFVNIAVDTNGKLPVPIYFKTNTTHQVSDVEECLQIFQSRAGGSCEGFYLALGGITCHIGSFVTKDSGLGVTVQEALQLFSSHHKSVGKVTAFLL